MDITTLMTILAWGTFVGIVFSAIGAAGGILTSFGLITLFGVLDPNSVKPMTQLVVLACTLIFVPSYLRWSGLVWPLGLVLGGAGLIGAFAGSTFSSIYLADMQTFRPVFGVLTLAIGVQIIWKLRQKWNTAEKICGDVDPSETGGVSQLCLTWKVLTFSYCEKDFRIPLWSPLVAGVLIAFTASVFGVGGGFLLVPYMASILSMPMHIIPATAAIAIFMSLAVSISNFLFLGAPIDTGILAPLVAGAVLGAIVGPRINMALKNHWLQTGLAVIVLGIGVKYVLS